jgi:putative transposase
VVGRLSRSLRTDLALDALEMSRYTQRLAEAAAAPSVGSTGDSYDCEHRQRAGRGVQLPFHGRIGCATAGPGRASTTSTAVAEYIDRFNHRRLHGEIGLVPPAEREDTIRRHNRVATTVAASVPSPH